MSWLSLLIAILQVFLLMTSNAFHKRKVSVHTRTPLLVDPMQKKAFDFVRQESSLKMVPSAERATVAILFDCDGVIVETEELHRAAYNKAFSHFGLQHADGTFVHWDIPYYEMLQNTVGGGKPKMRFHFNEKAPSSWPHVTLPTPRAAPVTASERDELIDMLQNQKNTYYKEVVEKIAVARPGVLDLMDAAIALKLRQQQGQQQQQRSVISDPWLKIGICSASSRAGFDKLVERIVGRSRLQHMDVILAGEDVPRRKPDPQIYTTARDVLQIPRGRQCLVVEDSLIGVQAAVAADMHCLVTHTPSTRHEDFYGAGAAAVLPSLQHVTLDDLLSFLTAQCDPHADTRILLPELRETPPALTIAH